MEGSERLISPDTASAIQALDRVLEAMSGEANARLWSIAGLESAEWDVVRRQARVALDRFAAESATGDVPGSPTR